MGRLGESAAVATGAAFRRLNRSPGVSVGRDVRLFGVPLITAALGASVRLADGVRLVSMSRWTPLGVNHRTIIRALRSGAEIDIGAETAISGGTVCALGSVRIGRRCLFGANVTVIDSDFHPVHDPLQRYRAEAPPFVAADAVRIGDHVFLGAGSIVLKGVSIGDNSVVGAGAVVTADVPADTIVAGNPAVVVGRVRG